MSNNKRILIFTVLILGVITAGTATVAATTYFYSPYDWTGLSNWDVQSDNNVEVSVRDRIAPFGDDEVEIKNNMAGNATFSTEVVDKGTLTIGTWVNQEQWSGERVAVGYHSKWGECYEVEYTNEVLRIVDCDDGNRIRESTNISIPDGEWVKIVLDKDGTHLDAHLVNKDGERLAEIRHQFFLGKIDTVYQEFEDSSPDSTPIYSDDFKVTKTEE